MDFWQNPFTEPRTFPDAQFCPDLRKYYILAPSVSDFSPLNALFLSILIILPVRLIMWGVLAELTTTTVPFTNTGSHSLGGNTQTNHPACFYISEPFFCFFPFFPSWEAVIIWIFLRCQLDFGLFLNVIKYNAQTVTTSLIMITLPVIWQNSTLRAGLQEKRHPSH